MKTKLSWMIALALVAPVAAQAGDLSYTYIEGGYFLANPDENDVDSVDGWAVRGSGAVTENIHVFGSYEKLTEEDHGDHVDWLFGLGYNTPVSDTLDIFGRIAYEELNLDDTDTDANGWQVGFGLRKAFTPKFEGEFGIRHSDIEDDTLTGVALGGQYSFNPTWGLSADVFLHSDGQSFFIGPRATF